MLSTAHTLASLPFGVFIANPWLALIYAAFFHMISDSLLHWNIYPHHFKRYPFGLVALDVFGGLIIAWLVVGQETAVSTPVLFAVLGGNLPDIAHSFWELTPKDKRRLWPKLARVFFKFHHHIQKETDSIPLGLISQIIIVSASLALIWLA